MGERREFARQHVISRAIRAARDAGMDVGGVEVLPNGGVRVLAATQIPPSYSDPVSEWEAKDDARGA